MREQRFLVSSEPFYTGFWSSFVALWTPGSRALARNTASLMRGERNPAYLFRSVDLRYVRMSGKSLCSSIVIHAAAVFLAFYVAQLPAPVLRASPISEDSEKIYYFPPPQRHETLPRITPPGPGGSPGHGVRPEVKPKLGSTAFHRDLTVISNPVHPDNNHQTIIQASSPPNLIIKQDLKLPNLVLGNPMARPKAPLQFAADPLKPIAPENRAENVAAPQVATIDPGQLTALAATVKQPQLPIVPLAAPKAAAGRSAASTAGGGGVASGGNLGDPNGLLILGTDPAAPGSSISLPPGNRFGAFSLSSSGGGPGSPGGAPDGVVGGGTGGSGSGGDESTGLGGGKTGGGGGGALSAAAPVSVAGPGAISGTRGNLEASIAAESVFPVISDPHMRRNSLVISTGSTGGGGLGVYQALQCGRIYTIFVPMPTGNWTLEYCQQDPSQANSRPSANSKVLQTEAALFPPEPLEKFDFHRLPVPAEKARGMLVLKGVVRADGVVDNLEVYQSVMRELDDRALAALKRWKFVPARRNDKPVAIQILVGIQLPATAAR